MWFGLPVNDWQFWAVTLVALAGLALVVRTLWPRIRKRGTKGRKVNLTVGGRKV